VIAIYPEKIEKRVRNMDNCKKKNVIIMVAALEGMKSQDVINQELMVMVPI
jgi:hypothetical protein